MSKREEEFADPLEEVARAGRSRGAGGMLRRYRRLPANVFAISTVSLLNDASALNSARTS